MVSHTVHDSLASLAPGGGCIATSPAPGTKAKSEHASATCMLHYGN